MALIQPKNYLNQAKPIAPTGPKFNVVPADPTSLGGTQGLGLKATTPTNNLATPTAPLAPKFTAPVPSQTNTPSLSSLTGTNYAVSTGNQQAPTAPTPVAPTAPVNPYQAPASGGLYGQLISGLAGMGATESPDIAKYRQQIQDISNQYAQRTGALERSGVDMSLATGEEGVMARQQAAQQSAAQQGLANALQSQQQRGAFLGTAAGLAAPQPAQALGFYNPATGQYSPYGGGTGSGAFGAGQVSGQVGLGQQYTQVLQPAYTQATTIKDRLVNFLQQNPDINPTYLSRGNALLNALRGELSDPKVNQLSQLLTEYTNTLSPIIGVTGGTVTDFKQSLVNSLLNPSARNQDLQELLNTTQGIVGGKLEDFKKIGQGGETVPTSQSSNPVFGSFF